MFSIQVTVEGTKCQVVHSSLQVTSSAKNVFAVSFTFSSEWDGLTKVAVFRAGGYKKAVIFETGQTSCNIPAEVLQSPSRRLEIGVQGYNEEKDLVLPTNWDTVCDLTRGADFRTEDTEIDLEVGQSLYERLLQAVDEKVTLAVKTSTDQLTQDMTEKVENATDQLTQDMTEKVEAHTTRLTQDMTEKVEAATDQLTQDMTEKVENATDQLTQGMTEKVENATDQLTQGMTEKVEAHTTRLTQDMTEKVEAATDQLTQDMTEKVENATDQLTQGMTEKVDTSTDRLLQGMDERVGNEVTNEVTKAIIRGDLTGPQGEKGDKGDTGDQGPKGDKGEPGYTPVRGTDYWTEADKAAIEQDVLNTLETPVQEALSQVATVEETREAAERARRTSEEARETAETERIEAENLRITAEEARVEAEEERQKTTESMEQATKEAQKVSSQAAETADQNAETAKALQEAISDIGQESTAQDIYSKVIEAVEYLKMISEEGMSSGDLNGFSLTMLDDGGVLLGYTDPDTGEEYVPVTMARETTAQDLADTTTNMAELLEQLAEREDNDAGI
jgi:hypothetical protein